jgi:hypothetical protein
VKTDSLVAANDRRLFEMLNGIYEQMIDPGKKRTNYNKSRLTFYAIRTDYNVIYRAFLFFLRTIVKMYMAMDV